MNEHEHHASVMIWTKGSESKEFIQSEDAASDFILYNNKNDF
ncbi:MAG: hypothetical protein RIC95_03030 [Vicingaceae bacterium]